MAYGNDIEMRKPSRAAYDIKKIEQENDGVFDLLSEGGNPIDLFPSDKMSHDPDAEMGLDTKSPFTEKMDLVNKFISTPEFLDLDPFQQDKILKAHKDLTKLAYISEEIAIHGKGMNFGDMSDEEAAILLGKEQFEKEQMGEPLADFDYRHPSQIKRRRETQENLAYGEDPLITDIIKIMSEDPGWFSDNPELEAMRAAKSRERKQFYDHDEKEWKETPRHGDLSKEDMGFIQDILDFFTQFMLFSAFITI